MKKFFKYNHILFSLIVMISLSCGTQVPVTDTITPPIGGYVNEGTTTAPVTFAVNTNYNGQAMSSSYYEVTGLTAGVTYMVHMTNITANADLRVYTPGSAFTSPLPECSSTNANTISEACAFTAIGTTELIEAVAANGSSFTLNVTGNNTGGTNVNEGTTTVPVAFAVNTNYNGQALTSSYYQITGLTAGATYLASMTNITGDVSLWVFPPGLSMFNAVPDCVSANSGTLNESCSFTATGATELIEAFATIGSTFTLNVTCTAGCGAVTPSGNQGTITLPQNVASTAVPYTGSVGAGGFSYYAVATDWMGLNQHFLVSLTGMSADVDLYVYTNSTFTTLSCSSVTVGIVNESCTTVEKGSFIYIKVYSASAATFQINLANLGTPANQGSQTLPVAIPFVNLPASGTVQPNGSSLYQITGLTAGHNYMVTVTGMTEDVDLGVYSDLFITMQCMSMAFGTADEACSASATGTSLYLWISANSNYGSMFTISATDLGLTPVSEGTLAVPIILTTGIGGNLPYNGSTAGNVASSYYSVSPITIGNNYTFSLSGLIGNVWFYVYSDAAHTNLICNNNGSATPSCNGIGTGATMYIQITGADLPGATYQINVTDLGAAFPTLAVNTPNAGLTGVVGSNKYTFATTVGNNYIVTVTGYTDPNKTLIANDNDATFITWVTDSWSGAPGVGLSFSFNASSANSFIDVFSSIADTYTVSIVDNGVALTPVNEGTIAAPTLLAWAPGGLTHNGTVVTNGRSYYAVSGLTIGTTYTVRLTGLLHNADLYCYNADSTYTTTVATSFNTASTEDACSFTATATSGYIKVFGSGGGWPSQYQLKIY